MDSSGRFWDGAVLPLVKVCESLYTNNCVLRELAEKAVGQDWKIAWAQARLTKESDGHTHKLFEQVYASLGDERAFHEAIQELLRIKSVL